MSESATAATPAQARHSLTHPRKRRIMRPLLMASGLLAGAVVLGVVGTGGTYALWGGNVQVDAPAITAGTTGLTINGEQSHSLGGLNARLLGPGDSVATAITVANTGSTAVNMTVSQSVVTAQTKALAGKLMLRLTPVASTADCVVGLAGGTSGRIAGFTTTATPVSLAVGAAQAFCLQLTLDTDAPGSMQGGTASFTLTVDAEQKAP